jgi:ferrous iron transport protein A
MKTLNDLKIGQSARVTDVLGDGALRRHILDMGVTKGADVTIKKAAPLGDPLQISVRGYELSLRRDDAKLISVEA